jgi:Mrp family chromosome partitioning ATPase
MLAGRAKLPVITRIPVFRNLSILQAGTMPPNPIELISRGLKNCLRQFQTQYDVILIDTSPAEQGMDSQLISSICGGALLLARQHKTPFNDLQLLKTALQDMNCECLVAVLINF